MGFSAPCVSNESYALLPYLTTFVRSLVVMTVYSRAAGPRRVRISFAQRLRGNFRYERQGALGASENKRNGDICVHR